MDKYSANHANQGHQPIRESEQAALRWLEQVDGIVYHNRNQEDDESAFVAVVNTPAANGQVGKVILAFGETIQEAAAAAEEEWNNLWSNLSANH